MVVVWIASGVDGGGVDGDGGKRWWCGRRVVWMVLGWMVMVVLVGVVDGGLIEYILSIFKHFSLFILYT